MTMPRDKNGRFIKRDFQNLSEEQKKKMSISKLEEKNPMWKGDEVGYHAIHSWVRIRKPKPKLCEKCNERKAYDLANISGKYLRDVNDFWWLCRSCHMKDDGRIYNLKKHLK